MTLIEILVVIAIVGIMSALGMTAVRSIFELNLEKAAQDLSSTIRFAYGEAVRRNEIYRLVIDLDQGKYSLESAPNTPESLAAILAEPEEETSGASSDSDKLSADTNHEEEEAAPAPVGFQPLEASIVKLKSIAPIKFASFFASHGEKMVEEGTDYLYFFPNGSTEYAIINLSDEDGETTYSIEVNPLTGSTILRAEAREPLKQ